MGATEGEALREGKGGGERETELARKAPCTFAYSVALLARSTWSISFFLVISSYSEGYMGVLSRKASSPYICFQLMVPLVQLTAWCPSCKPHKLDRGAALTRRSAGVVGKQAEYAQKGQYIPDRRYCRRSDAS